jgi:hypothetical protein
MFPTPFEKYIPQHWTRTQDVLAFAAQVDKMITDTENEIFGLADLLNPEKCPARFLDYLGYWINAGLNAQDTETQKRIKIVTAVAGHKIRGSFNFDAKPKIDAIAGGDSKIITQNSGPGWMLVTDETSRTIDQCILLTDNDGFLLFTAGDILGYPWNVFIDVDNPALSAEDQERIRLDMEDIVPAYYIVHFGYVDGAGIFIEYFRMP